MSKRIAPLTVIFLSLTLLPGCPAASRSLGLWTFSVFGSRIVADLQANGDVVSIGSTSLTGIPTWEANRTEFIIRIQAASSTIALIGRVTNNSSMSGVTAYWDPPDASSGDSWSAVKQ